MLRLLYTFSGLYSGMCVPPASFAIKRPGASDSLPKRPAFILCLVPGFYCLTQVLAVLL